MIIFEDFEVRKRSVIAVDRYEQDLTEAVYDTPRFLIKYFLLSTPVPDIIGYNIIETLYYLQISLDNGASHTFCFGSTEEAKESRDAKYEELRDLIRKM
jgi:hypothetical protein